MDTLTLLTSILTAVGGTGYFTFLFTKRKYNVEVVQAQEQAESVAIDNDIKLSAHYKEILDDLKNRYETRYQEFESIMQRKVDLLQEEITLRDKKIKELTQEINALKKENKRLRDGNNSKT